MDRAFLVEFALDKLSPDESLRILDRVSSDKELSADLDLVLLMLKEGEREGLLNREAYEERGGRGSRLREWSGFSLTVLRTAAMLCVLVGAGLVFREVSKPRYFDIAAVGSSDLDFRMRGGSGDIMGLARASLLKGEREDALRITEWYLAVYPDGTERSEAHLLRATTFLIEARSERIGILVSFDRAMVDEAWTELQRARTESGSDRMREHIAWFEAKVFLMKGDVEEARTQFECVASIGGARADEAKRMLRHLDSEVKQ